MYYYIGINFDSGKAACFCAMQARCTNCHGGRAGTMDQNLAHEGLVASPVKDNAAVCQNCHPRDYQDRAQKIIAVMGVAPTPIPASVSRPAAPGAGGDAGAEHSTLLDKEPASSWKMLSLAILGLSFIGVFLFGCRCWRLDHVEPELSI